MGNETFVVRLPLGTFALGDPKSPEGWQPNPWVPMSAQQQFNHNVEADYLRGNTPNIDKDVQ